MYTVYWCLFQAAVPHATLTVNVPSRLFDGALRNKGRVLCVTWNHHGAAPLASISWRQLEVDVGG